MTRLAAAAFAALVMATVGAFFVTQHLKVSTPLIAGSPQPTPDAINPLAGKVCGGVDHRTAQFSFYLLHRADDVAVYVVDPSGTIVRTLSSGRHMRRGVRRPDGEFPWDGREDNGRPAPDGTYYFRIALLGQGRTIELTKTPVLVRTVPPHPVVSSVSPSLIPHGDAAVRIEYTGNERRGGTIQLYRTDLGQHPRLVKSFSTPWNGSVAIWDGKIHSRPAPAGTYLVGLAVTDKACNTGQFPTTLPPNPGGTPHAGVTVRYLAVQPPLDPVPAGSTATVYVDSRQKPYTWTLQRAGSTRAAARGSGRAPALRISAPTRAGAGAYVLSVRSASHATAVPLTVGRAPNQRTGANILVVLPALTWQGQNPVDDDGDGIPNTLDAGDEVQLERPLAEGLPPGFGDQAAFLAHLEKAHLSYDLTTDLGLIDGVGPALGRHRAIVFAGNERWLPPSLSASLRAYAQSGGRVLSLGIDSLRRGVTLRAGKALAPTTPTVADTFGARPGPLTKASTDLITVIDDGLGIFAGTSGAFPGYTTYQPFAPGPQPFASAAGTTTAATSVVGFRLGDGIVVEVGLPGFASSLERNVDAQALVRRLWMVLGH